MPTNFLFVCGFPSSGTDLLRNILNAHPKIHIGGEFPLLPSLAKTCEARVSPARIIFTQNEILRCDVYGNLQNRNVDLACQEDIQFADIFAKMLSAEKADWYGNKTPQNTENIDKLTSLFPTAKFIILIRDIRDVAVSWRRKWGKDMYLCASKWTSRMSRGVALTELLQNDRYIFISYERLLQDFELETRKLCTFLNIEFDSRVLQFHKHVKDIVPGKVNFGQAIVADNRQKWVDELDDRSLRRIEEIAWPMMCQFGYRPEIAVGHSRITRFEQYRGLFRDVFAIIFIGNRAMRDRHLLYRLTSIRVLLRKFLSRYFRRTA